MPAFRFTLARVLAWRELQRDIEEQKLLALRGELEALETELSRLAAERERALAAAGGLGVELAQLAVYEQALAARERSGRARREDCRRRLAAQHARWSSAERACRLLEKLKARRKAEFTAAEGRELERLANELFLAAWGRQTGGRE